MKKIMFNDKYGLTKAVLEGRKTQTRRIVTDKLFQERRSNGFYDAGGFNDEWKTKTMELLVKISPYKIGEEVAVAQSYKDAGRDFYCHFGLAGWHNKMFVRSEIMPHRIRITNVRVERLQDISEEDCLAEGVYYHTEPPKHHEHDRYSPWSPSVKPYKFESEKYYCSAKYAFMHLIDKVCKKGTWRSNPYVFVYDFELIKINTMTIEELETKILCDDFDEYTLDEYRNAVRDSQRKIDIDKACEWFKGFLQEIEYEDCVLGYDDTDELLIELRKAMEE